MDSRLLDYLWIVTASGLVFFMQPGFAMLESGLTRSKNSINVSIKNLTDLGFSMLTFWVAGFALMFGPSFRGLFGTGGFLLPFSGDGVVWNAVFFLFQAMFCSTAATIVSGAVAERMRYSSYLICTVILSALVYPVFGHWAWGGLGNMDWDASPGWLAALGFVDFAGSSAVHSVGGWTSLAAILIIGGRTGRFPKDGKPRSIQGSDIPLSVLGVFILWFGWIGFNGGSTFAMNAAVPGIIMRTCLAAAAGMVITLTVGWAVYRVPDISFVINGSLAGLVAITAPCHAVNEWQSIVIGGAGGLVALGTSALLEKLKVDDAVGAIPVHLAAGIWGTLAVGIFGNAEILGTSPILGSQLLAQAIGVIACALWSFGSAYLLFLVVNRIHPLRVSAEDEEVGLNVSEHGASTELHELFSIMGEQARTGDLSLRLPVEPFTEVGRIAQHYNRAMEGFQKNLVARTDYAAILDAVSDGLFLLGRDLRINAHYSAATERIFSRASLSDVDLRDLLKPMLTEKVYDSALEYLDLLFDPKMRMKSLLQVNPLKEAEFYVDTGEGRFESRFLRLDFSRIPAGGNQGGIDSLMVVVRDLTEQTLSRRETETERQRSQGEMELFYRILHIDPELFSEFLEGMQEDLDDMNAALEGESEALQDRLLRMFRRVHSIKGNASLLELDFIVTEAHAYEDRIAALRERNDLDTADFLPLAVALSGLYGLLAQARRLADRLGGFRGEYALTRGTEGELVALQLKKLVEGAASSMGKQARLDYEHFSARELPPRRRRRTRDALIQLVRNAVAHGIEPPAVRTAAGKDATGTIAISTKRERDVIAVTVRDDGAGVNFASLATAAGVDADTPKDRALLAALSRGASTAEAVGMHAGRGVGLGVVKTVLEELRGTVVLRTRRGAFSEFTLRIPTNDALPQALPEALPS